MKEMIHESDLICKALLYASEGHAGQFRRDGKTPYISHPIGVCDLLEGQPDEIRATALLHDVLEDTKISLGDLLHNFRKEIVDAVIALTHKDGESYVEYLVRVKENPIARKVKIADMLHNLSCNPTKNQVDKYLKGLKIMFEDNDNENS